MRTLKYCLVGTSPLLLHRIARHQLREQIASRGRAGLSLEAEALESMLKNDQGNPVIPSSWLLDAMRVACGRITVGGEQLSFFRLSSVFRILDELLTLKDKNNRSPHWIVYTSSQHESPKSRGLIAVVAPKFVDWKVDVSIGVGGAFPSDDLLHDIMNEAGRVGIGLFHPPKKHFGQFRVCFRSVC